MLSFEWNEEKARKKTKKYKVSFFEAVTVFDALFSLTIDEPMHSFDQERFITIGYSEQQRLLTVIHTERGDNIRIISARQATNREKQDYDRGL